ncbi:MAG: hypothetical protein LBT46_08955, partial [Planctomycetaceae bacterium]|nr:hypothetical protein [Planctomycetaceae bacterium]
MQSSLLHNFVTGTPTRPLLEQERCDHKIGYLPADQSVFYVTVFKTETLKISLQKCANAPLQEAHSFSLL